MSNNTPKISLSFSKIIERKKLQTSALGNDNSQIKQENKQSILLFDKNIKPSEPSKPEDTLVIPLVESKRDTIYKNLKEKKNNSPTENANQCEMKEMTLEEQAAAAVIEECTRKMEELENRSSNDVSFRQNMINISNLNELQDTDGVISSLEDYEQINVQHFGAALLRGMGWSKDQGIGKNKKIIEIINPTNKGLTLAKKEEKQKDKGEKSEEEEELKKGCRVLIEGGRNRGTYGIIESVDEDHILVRTAREGKVLRDVEQNVRVVLTKEYKEFSRVINKNMYDDFKVTESRKRKEKQKDPSNKTASEDYKKIKKTQDSRQEEKAAKQDINPRNGTQNKDRTNDGPQDRDKLNNKDCPNVSESLKDRSKKNYDEYIREKERHRKEKHKEEKYKCKEEDKGEKYRYKEEDKGKSREDSRYGKEISKSTTNSTKKHSLPLPTIPWARENLRVRIIDKEYKGGKYHKEKVIVSSIDTVKSCTCMSEEGKTLYDVNPNHLETVIPKTSSAIVLIVKGNYKGQKARILELHKEKEKATIQLLDESSVILKLYYDDICEYTSR